MKFDEFEAITGQKVFVSATPADYELEKSEGLVVEQVVRPTGLLDPPIEVRPTENQVDDLLEEIRKRAELDERVLVTTLTKRMAEELEKYFTKMGVRSVHDQSPDGCMIIHVTCTWELHDHCMISQVSSA